MTIDVAAVLVGGLGTRLRAAVPGVPKPLAPVQGRPFLDRLLDWLEREGVSRAALLCGHGSAQLEAFAAGRAAAGKGPALECSIETAALGTGGAVRLALELLPPEFFLVNGDTLCPVSLRDLEARHRESGADATLTAVFEEDGAARGALEMDAAGRVTGFAEKARGGPGWISAGVYALRGELFRALPPGTPGSLELDLLPGWIARGLNVRAFRAEAPFLDIGTPADWERAQREGWLS